MTDAAETVYYQYVSFEVLARDKVRVDAAVRAIRKMMGVTVDGALVSRELNSRDFLGTPFVGVEECHSIPKDEADIFLKTVRGKRVTGLHVFFDKGESATSSLRPPVDMAPYGSRLLMTENTAPVMGG